MYPSANGRAQIDGRAPGRLRPGRAGASADSRVRSRLRGDIPLETLKARWAGGASQFVAVDGMGVHVRDEGSGPAVVLLHGTSSSLHTWDGWVERLRQGHRVVRFDLPAFGLTGPSPARDYSIDAYTAFVDHLTTRLGLQRFVLAGNSLGGGIAWAYALAHPDRVRALILVDAVGYPARVRSSHRLPHGPLARPPVTAHTPRPSPLGRERRAQVVRRRLPHPPTPSFATTSSRCAPATARPLVDRMRVPQRDDSARIRELRQPTLICGVPTIASSRSRRRTCLRGIFRARR